MLGKSEEWSREEIRVLILFLDDVGFRNEEICRKIWEVCGLHSVSRDEVYRTLDADKQAKVLADSSSDPFDVLLTDEVEISNFLDLYDERILNYCVQSSKCKWNQWNCSKNELYKRKCYSESQHHSLDVKKATDLQNSEGRDKVYEKLHTIFKNFSPQNFTVSPFEIKELHITTEDNLREVTDIVFEKAVEKSNFSIPYANLCKCLTLLKVPCSGQKGQFVDTGELLFAKCQKEFEKNEVGQLCREEESRPFQGNKEQLLKISEEKLERRRQLGTARFMGWLLKLGIFTESMMHQVIKVLLLQDDEIAVECVCLLIASIGNELDCDKVESYIFEVKKKRIDKPCGSAKLEVILQQISDLKVNNWEKSTKIIDEILSEDQEEKNSKKLDETLSENQAEIQKHRDILLQMEYDDSLSGYNEQQKMNLQASVELKQYDRKFLLNLQHDTKSVKRPVDLPNLDRIKIKEVTKLQESDFLDGVKVQQVYNPVVNVQLHNSFVLSSEEAKGKNVNKSAVKKEPKDKTTLNYKGNQWSPWNLEGKRQYDREFLLNLQSGPLSMKKPSNLPDLDVIKDKASLQKLKKMNRKIQSAAQRARYANLPESAIPVVAPGHGPNNWVPCHDENNPKTIDQIHKEAEREAHEQHQMLQKMTFPKRMPDDHDRQKNRPHISEDGWNMLGKSSKGNFSVDPMKLKLTKPAKVESIQLGLVGKLASWAKGSSGGAESSSIEQDSRPVALQNNRYSVFADQTPLPYETRSSQRSAASSCESSRGLSNQLPSPATRKTVKTFTRTGPPQPRKPQEAQNVNGEDVTLLKGADLSQEEIEKKTKPLIDEFLHNSDLQEAVQCVVELASSSTVCVFITSAVNQVLERSSQSRHMLAKLLHTLLKRKIITMDQYNKGLKDVLKFVDEYALDIPLIWDYLGELIEPILDDDFITLAFLKDTLQPCIPSQTAGKLVSAVLLCASKKRGTLRVGEMWKESKLSWNDFLEPNADIEDFVKTHKLEFTSKQVAEPKLRKQITPEDVKKNLQRLLHDHDTNEEIFNWLERHIEGEVSPSIYRALVTAIYESVITRSGANCELNTAKLKERMCILARYMDVNRNLELHAIFALQYLMNKLDHPKGILLQIFDLAYNEDFLSDDAFKQWEQCNDPAEQEGKGVAIHSVSSFFTCLTEEENDESAEGD